jgi:hypothetical protein
MERRPLKFSLKPGRKAKFRAHGLELPISAEADSLRELRAKLEAAGARLNGAAIRVIFLVGVGSRRELEQEPPSIALVAGPPVAGRAPECPPR